MNIQTRSAYGGTWVPQNIVVDTIDANAITVDSLPVATIEDSGLIATATTGAIIGNTSFRVVKSGPLVTITVTSLVATATSGVATITLTETIPSHCRPPTSIVFPVFVRSGAVNQFGYCDVLSTGVLTFGRPSGIFAGSSGVLTTTLSYTLL